MGFMNIVIAGAGEVGRHAAEVLGGAGHRVTVIDTSVPLSPFSLPQVELTRLGKGLQGQGSAQQSSSQ